MNIADNLPVDFNFIRLESGQQRKSGIARAKIVNGQTNPFCTQLFNGAVKLIETGNHLVFGHFDDDLFAKQEDQAVVNPYGRVPVLVERDLILYEPNIINEYIDERFPHPQLMPPDPIMRARARQLLITMEREVFSHIEVLEKNLKTADKARQVIRDRLTEMAPVFVKQKHMLGEDFSMLDVAIAPLLWRLDHYGIELPKAAAPLMKYAERIFSRQGFIDALTPSEKAMRR